MQRKYRTRGGHARFSVVVLFAACSGAGSDSGEPDGTAQAVVADAVLAPAVSPGSFAANPLLFGHTARAAAIAYDEARGRIHVFDSLHSTIDTLDLAQQRAVRCLEIPAGLPPVFATRFDECFAFELHFSGPPDAIHVFELASGQELSPPLVLAQRLALALATPDQERLLTLQGGELVVLDARTFIETARYPYPTSVDETSSVPSAIHAASFDGGYAVYGVHNDFTGRDARLTCLRFVRGTQDSLVESTELHVPHVCAGAPEETSRGIQRIAFDTAATGVRRVFAGGVVSNDFTATAETRIVELAGDLTAERAEVVSSADPKWPASFGSSVAQSLTALVYEPRTHALLAVRQHPVHVPFSGPVTAQGLQGRIDVFVATPDAAPSATATFVLPGAPSALAFDGVARRAVVAHLDRASGGEPTLAVLEHCPDAPELTLLAIPASHGGDDALSLAFGQSELLIGELDRVRILDRATLAETGAPLALRGPGPFAVSAVGEPEVERVFATLTHLDQVVSIELQPGASGLVVEDVVRFTVPDRPLTLSNGRDAAGVERLFAPAIGRYGAPSDRVAVLSARAPADVEWLTGLVGPRVCLLAPDGVLLHVGNWGSHAATTDSFLGANVLTAELATGATFLAAAARGVSSLTRIDTSVGEPIYVAGSCIDGIGVYAAPSGGAAYGTSFGASAVTGFAVDRDTRFAYAFGGHGGDIDEVIVLDLQNAVASGDPKTTAQIAHVHSIGGVRFGAAVASPSDAFVFSVGTGDGNVHAVRWNGSSLTTESFPAGDTPIDLLTSPLHAGGAPHLFVADRARAEVGVYELVGRTRVCTIFVDDGPVDLAVDAAGTYLFVANSLAGTVSYVSLAAVEASSHVDAPSIDVR